MGRPSFLVRDSPPGGGPSRWLDFGEPRQVFYAWRLEEVLPQLETVEAAVAEGAWAVGFLAYEAAPAFDPGLVTHAADPAWPLAFWALTGPPREVALPAPREMPRPDWQPALSAAEHAVAVGEIRAAIARGETYQANFTFPFEADLEATLESPLEGTLEAGQNDPFDLFLALQAAQQGRHAAFLDLGELAVLSASPELFFRRDGERVVVRPMKGTARRGSGPEGAAAARRELHSEKNRAENLMIVDMMRNDLGKVAVPGSVQVAALFAVEEYPSVLQLVSEVAARTTTSQVELLRALFPCASITGAPKAATQAILRRLEAGPRGVYTGAVGYFAPGRVASFAVAIRTIAWQQPPGEPARLRFGSGGGIVWDSVAADEYRECEAKALVLQGLGPAVVTTAPAFELLETLLWRPRSGFFLLERHLARLTASAAFFGFAMDRAAVATALAAAAADFPPGRCRVRLLLAPGGECRIAALAMPCEGPRGDLLLALDSQPVDATDVFLFHKTTRRQRYDAALARFPAVGEVILWNSRGELTETTRGNLVLRFGQEYLTPALACGLLPGVYRGELLARGRIREARLETSALEAADAIFHLSAFRGWWRGRLAPT